MARPGVRRDRGLREVLARERVTGYSGFDPTAPSLHVGHLLPIMALARLQRLRPFADRARRRRHGTDRRSERQDRRAALLTVEQVEANVAGIRAQLARFLDFDSAANPARLVNNAEWLTKLGAIEFMRDVGKHFTVNAMLAKESVKRRIESDDGISYTEFSYSLLQAYDFLVLYDRFGCTLQMGGSDQWGNITAGMDSIRRVRGAQGARPRLAAADDGVRDEVRQDRSGSVWLDAQLTRPYEFYQFWLNTDDRDVVQYLKFFTFLRRIASRSWRVRRRASPSAETPSASWLAR